MKRLLDSLERIASIERSLPGAPGAACRSESCRRRKPNRRPDHGYSGRGRLTWGNNQRVRSGLASATPISRSRPDEDGDKPTVEVIASSMLATERGKNLEPVAHKPASFCAVRGFSA